MQPARAWVLTAIFVGAATACLLSLYMGTDCAYSTDRPHCGPNEEVAATFLGFGGYGLLFVGAIFLVRAIWLELRRPATPAA